MGFDFNPSFLFICRQCKYTFPNTDDFKRHKLETHLSNCLDNKFIIFEEKLVDEDEDSEWISRISFLHDTTASSAGTYPGQSQTSSLHNDDDDDDDEDQKFSNSTSKPAPAKKPRIQTMIPKSELNNRRKRKYLGPVLDSVSGKAKFLNPVVSILPLTSEEQEQELEQNSSTVIPHSTVILKREKEEESEMDDENQSLELNFEGLDFPAPVTTKGITSDSFPLSSGALSDDNEGEDEDQGSLRIAQEILSLQHPDEEIIDEEDPLQLETNDLNEVSSYFEQQQLPLALPTYFAFPVPDPSPITLAVEYTDSVRDSGPEPEPEPVVKAEGIRNEIPPVDPEKPFMCHLCFATFRLRKGVYQHMKTHTNITPFHCTHCDAKFKYKQSLQRHFKVHGKEASHKCTLCLKTFHTQGDLNDHARTHTGERPFKCLVPYCSRTFTSKAILNGHVRMQHGDELGLQQFVCPVCGRVFGIKSQLNVHVKSHEGQNQKQQVQPCPVPTHIVLDVPDDFR